MSEQKADTCRTCNSAYTDTRWNVVAEGRIVCCPDPWHDQKAAEDAHSAISNGDGTFTIHGATAAAHITDAAGNPILAPTPGVPSAAPTPRTDILYLNFQQTDVGTAFNAMHDFAMQLERERDSFHAQLCAEIYKAIALMSERDSFSARLDAEVRKTLELQSDLANLERELAAYQRAERELPPEPESFKFWPNDAANDYNTLRAADVALAADLKFEEDEAEHFQKLFEQVEAERDALLAAAKKDSERLDLLEKWALADDQDRAEKIAHSLHVEKISLRDAIDDALHAQKERK